MTRKNLEDIMLSEIRYHKKIDTDESIDMLSTVVKFIQSGAKVGL